MLLAGCLTSPAPAGAGDSGFFGVATIGPTCPVERDPPDPACADKPFEGDFAVTTPDGSGVVTEFSSDAQGRFNVTVGAGEYAIRLANSASPLPRCASAAPLVVASRAWSEVNVSCDSGIR